MFKAQPAGTALYVGYGVGKFSMEHLIKSLRPFCFTLLALLLFLFLPGVRVHRITGAPRQPGPDPASTTGTTGLP